VVRPLDNNNHNNHTVLQDERDPERKEDENENHHPGTVGIVRHHTLDDRIATDAIVANHETNGSSGISTLGSSHSEQPRRIFQ
jgi:hypothetical protein